jgi:hypothetical protein
LRTSKAELSKLQRLAYLGIPGAMRTVPIAAIEVPLGLYCSDHWKPDLKDMDIYKCLRP